MPGVLNRYIKYENAGDQFVGKAVSGRTRNKKEFGESPAYWDFTSDDEGERERKFGLVADWLKAHLPASARENHKVFALFRMAVATIVQHGVYLDTHLHPRSTLRTNLLWTDDIPFADAIVTKFP